MTQRLFLQGLLAGAFGTLLGGTALLYTLARLGMILVTNRSRRPRAAR